MRKLYLAGGGESDSIVGMQSQPIPIFQVFCVLGLIITLLAGAYLWKNFDRYFGPDPNVPSERSSGRSYTRVQVFAIWAHAVVFFALSALLLH